MAYVIVLYQMMDGFSPVCRTDVSELMMKPIRYHAQSGASRLRRMVFCKDYIPA
jgi:hypothetical protein